MQAISSHSTSKGVSLVITTVGQLRAASKDYNDENPVILESSIGGGGYQQFPIESVGHDPGQVIINIGDEFLPDGSYRR